jgi:TetR/AcrR family transcriptional regulator
MPADAADTRRAILDAAETLFSEKGFAAASMSAIAEVAQVSKGLLHHHYGSKEGLWHAVKERRFGEFWSAQAELYEAPANHEWFERSLRGYFAFLQANPSFVRLMTWHFVERQEIRDDETVGPPQVTEAVKRVREHQKAGFLRADIAPFNIVAMFFSLIVHWHEAKSVYVAWFRGAAHQSTDKDDKSYLNDMVRVFLRGLRVED